MTLYCDAPMPLLATRTSRRKNDDYVVAVFERLQRLASHSYLSSEDADDAVQRCILKLLRTLRKLQKRYPEPDAAAAALWASGPSDFLRAERVQRGQGAHLKDGPDETRVARRRIVDIESPDVQRPLVLANERLGNGVEEFQRIEHLQELVEALGTISPLTWHLLWLVHVEGYSVTEAAGIVSCSRSHASRLISRVKVQLGNLADAA